jgi:hypothetical protein
MNLKLRANLIPTRKQPCHLYHPERPNQACSKRAIARYDGGFEIRVNRSSSDWKPDRSSTAQRATVASTFTFHPRLRTGGERLDSVVTAITDSVGDIGTFNLAGIELKQEWTSGLTSFYTGSGRRHPSAIPLGTGSGQARPRNGAGFGDTEGRSRDSYLRIRSENPGFGCWQCQGEAELAALRRRGRSSDSNWAQLCICKPPGLVGV